MKEKRSNLLNNLNFVFVLKLNWKPQMKNAEIPYSTCCFKGSAIQKSSPRIESFFNKNIQMQFL